MAINKNAHLRYLVLDRCLRNRRRQYTLSDLTDECNAALMDETGGKSTVTERQVRKDLYFLRDNPEISAPIEYVQDGHKRYFHYADHNFTISKMPLTEDEVGKIKGALNLLTRFRGMPQFGWIEEVVARLESSMFMKTERQSTIISFDENLNDAVAEFLEPVFNAIVNKQPILVHYDPMGGSPIDWTIHPYHLKQYNGRWFLFGQNNDFPTAPLTTIAIDRIVGVENADEKIDFIENEDVDFSEYFDDVVGVTIPANVEPIKIRFKVSQFRLRHVLTKALHPSQRHLKSEDESLFEITVIPNPELYSLFLSFGKDLEIVSPEEIRREMTIRANLLAETYSKD